MARPRSARPAGARALRERVGVPGALKFPNFRNYWLGLLASVAGHQMLVLFSLGWLMYNLAEGDTRFVGYMTACIAVPAILLNLFGGVFADKISPKRLLGVSQLVTAVNVATLGVLVLLEVANEWHVLGAAFLLGTVQAFDDPTRQSIFPRLVGRMALDNAVVLNSMVWTGTRIIAPALAAMIVDRLDIHTAIFISASGFLVLSLVSQTLRLPDLERARGSVAKEMMLGFRFIRSSPIFSFLIGMTFFNSMFGMSYVFLMPEFANQVLGVGSSKIGWLLGASGAGGFTGLILAGNLGRVRQKGRFLIGGAVLFGIFLVLFALVSHLKLYELSLVILFLEGVANSTYLILVMTTLHSLVPDQFRGRVMGFYAITWSIVPLGGLQSNLIAHYLSAPIAVAIGGSLVIAFALGPALANPRIRAIGFAAKE